MNLQWEPQESRKAAWFPTLLSVLVVIGIVAGAVLLK